ncbi:MAG: integrase core domain-containing protein [Nitrospira sp.]|nr:integrase core domain-containing protein [Nitrospira sp.]
MRVHHVGFRILEFYRLPQLGHCGEMTPQDAQHRLTIQQFFTHYGQAETCEAFGVSRRTLYRWQQTLTQADGDPQALAALNPWFGPAKPGHPIAATPCPFRCSPVIPSCGCKPGSAATSSPSSLPTPPRFLLSHNGAEFLGHFQQRLDDRGSIHWWTYPCASKMHAQVERFNRTLQEQFVDYHEDLLFDDMTAFNQKLVDWLLAYNTVLPHHSLDRQSPVQFLIQHQPECPRWWTHTYT